MKLVVAVNNLGYIGKDGGMLWHCTEDLKHFKYLTLDTKCLVGRKTWEGISFLKRREFIVVGRDHLTLEEALAKDPDWVIGGGEIYKQLVHNCNEIHISIIDDNSIGDTKFDIPEDYRGRIFRYYFKPNKQL